MRNRHEDLAGFDFPHYDLNCAEIAGSRLVKETVNASLDDGLAFILTKDDLSTLQNDGCQVPGGWVYFDGVSDHIIAIEEIADWGPLWRRIGVEIQRENVPECVQ